MGGDRDQAQGVASDMSFARDWQAEVLEQPPLIAPARRFVYPRQVAGEEDTLARGALLLRVRPTTGGEFLATCARGFADARMLTGVEQAVSLTPAGEIRPMSSGD